MAQGAGNDACGSGGVKGKAMKRLHLGHGVSAFRWHGRTDPRGYKPPRGYTAEAALIEHHPATYAFLGRSEWWIFLTRKEPHA